MSTRHTRQLFICAALFNLLAGLPFLLVPGPAAELLGLPLNPTALLFIHITMGLVVLFGGVYWLIARDPVRYRPFISLGVVLKNLVVSSSSATGWPAPSTGACRPSPQVN